MKPETTVFPWQLKNTRQLDMLIENNHLRGCEIGERICSCGYDDARGRRIEALEKALAAKDIFIVENGLWPKFIKETQ